MRKPVSSASRRAAGAPRLAAGVADLRALAHPLRLRMMELFAEAPRTTKQVAELLGEPPTRLYHHVAALERAGLLALKEIRPNRGVVEKWYEAVARQMGSAQATGRRGAPARRALAMTVLEQARGELVAALARPERAAPLLVRLVMSVPPGKAPEVRARLLDAVQQIQRDAGCVDGDAVTANDASRWALTIAFAPVAAPVGAPARRRRGKR